jgi:Tfp pilus assembly ATPase PilU
MILDGLWFIEGSNGSGKSTIMEAISWVQFGLHNSLSFFLTGWIPITCVLLVFLFLWLWSLLFFFVMLLL